MIVIDWSILAAVPWYDTATNNVPLVGNKAGDLINFLVRENVTQLSKIHFVGHSLGAHVAGIAARRVTGGKIARVSGTIRKNPF